MRQKLIYQFLRSTNDILPNCKCVPKFYGNSPIQDHEPEAFGVLDKENVWTRSRCFPDTSPTGH